MSATPNSTPSGPASEPAQTTEVQYIQPDALMSIQVSTDYYRRVQNLLFRFIEGKTQDELAEARRQIENDEVVADWVRDYETLLILCHEIEHIARQEGLVKTTHVVL